MLARFPDLTEEMRAELAAARSAMAEALRADPHALFSREGQKHLPLMEAFLKEILR